MTKKIFAPVLGLFAVLGLYACLNSSDNAPSGPTITAQPRDTLALVGGTATFSVTASGHGTLSYAWTKGTAPVPGGTGDTLFLSNVSMSDTGSYQCTITDSVGVTASHSATLRVNLPPPPVITGQPSDTTVMAGSTVTFSVAAAGVGTLSYQWMKGASPVAGAVSARLTLSNVRVSDSGAYTCTVGNAGGSVTSAFAKLHVSPTFEDEAEVVSIGSQNIVTRDVSYECENGQPAEDTNVDTTTYLISNGALEVWSPGDCSVLMLNGSSSSVLGSWTTPALKFAAVPGTNNTCSGSDLSTELRLDSLLYQNVGVSYVISSENIQEAWYGQLCFASAYASIYAPENSGTIVTQDNCTSATIANGNNQTAAFTSSMVGGYASVTFKSGSTVCSETVAVSSNAIPDCSTSDSTADFDNCVGNSGFISSEFLAKKAVTKALPGKILRRLLFP